jgi:hypothetical protein
VHTSIAPSASTRPSFADRAREYRRELARTARLEARALRALAAELAADGRAGEADRAHVLAAAVERGTSHDAEGDAIPAIPAPTETRGWSGLDRPLPADAGRPSNGRMAFTVHDPELINHYCHVWRRLDPARFEILAAAPDAIDNTRIAAFGAANGYPVRFLGAFLADLPSVTGPYELVVSNHIGSAGLAAGGEAILPRLGKRHVRMMYALGKSRWNFAEWNELYETILCWGPYQATGLGQRTHPRLAQVGYPRFDPFFWPMEDRAEAVRALGGDPDRPTVVWLPTWGELSSIDLWAEPVGKLATDFNLLVKVHPLTTAQEPERMARLREAGIEPIADPTLNNIRLLTAADHVLADYGGSPFGALAADRDVVLLDVPGAAEHPLTGEDSIDVVVRRWLTHLDPGEAGALAATLGDGARPTGQRDLREGLRRSLFAPFEGIASDVVAALLAASLDERHSPLGAGGR